MTPPLCRDCRYHLTHNRRHEWCVAPQLEAADLVQYVRVAPSECGEEGKWFNPKDPAEQVSETNRSD